MLVTQLKASNYKIWAVCEDSCNRVFPSRLAAGWWLDPQCTLTGCVAVFCFLPSAFRFVNQICQVLQILGQNTVDFSPSPSQS